MYSFKNKQNVEQSIREDIVSFIPIYNEDQTLQAIHVYLPTVIDESFFWDTINSYQVAPLEIFCGRVRMITSRGSAKLVFNRPFKNRTVRFHDVSEAFQGELSMKPDLRENASVHSFLLTLHCTQVNEKRHFHSLKWEIEKYTPEIVLAKIQKWECPHCREQYSKRVPCSTEVSPGIETEEYLNDLLELKNPVKRKAEMDEAV